MASKVRLYREQRNVKTFNCGIGLILIISDNQQKGVISHLDKRELNTGLWVKLLKIRWVVK